MGYGRLCCERFPQTADADAVRFHVREEAGELISIQYIFEKDCWPKQHGVLEFAGSAVSSGPDDAVLRRQAAAFLESYLRRRS